MIQRHILSRFSAAIIIILMVVSTTSCASLKWTTDREDNVNINLIPDRRVHVSSPSIYQSKDQVIISGSLKSRRWRSRLHGHIDIAAMNAKGQIIYAKSIDIHRKFPFRRYRYRYKAVIPDSLHEGMTINIAYHKPTLKSGPFDCGNNVATIQ